MTEVSVERTIAAKAEDIYALVSELTRMGEWSPEATGGRWLKGATGPKVGAKFLGENASDGRSWKTLATVTEAQVAQRFAFRVTAHGLKVADWSYDIADQGNGHCQVIEHWVDRRGAFVMLVSRFLTGVTDRRSLNAKNMEATLAAIEASLSAA